MPIPSDAVFIEISDGDDDDLNVARVESTVFFLKGKARATSWRKRDYQECASMEDGGDGSSKHRKFTSLEKMKSVR